MLVQILISHYNESEDTVACLLNSIALQQGINFNTDVDAIICSDGGPIKLSESFINKWPFKVKYTYNEHKNISHVRNTLLEQSTGEYIMFCDADDMFIGLMGLYSIITLIKASPYDVIASRFFTELKPTDYDQHSYNLISSDMDFVHGKAFKRSYIMNSDIKFNSSLRNTDTLFLSLALNSTAFKTCLSEPFYLWKYNKISVCHSSENHFLEEMSEKIKRDDMIIDALDERNLINDSHKQICRTLYELHFYMIMKDWDSQKYSDGLNAYIDFYKKYKKRYQGIDNTIKNKMLNLANMNFYKIIGKIIREEDFNNWIKTLEGA